MTSPESLKGSADPHGPAAQLLDDDEIDRLVAEQNEDSDDKDGEEE
jgi:hypothetical protein